MRKEIKHTTAMKISLRRRKKRGHSSTAAVMKPSIVQNYISFAKIKRSNHPFHHSLYTSYILSSLNRMMCRDFSHVTEILALNVIT